ncbi:MAG: trypsin-like serine protease [Methylococcales bacterium]|nr:trypsin-like serine protease [Methylococcales bacterium]
MRSQNCTGFLIAPCTALTALHCLNGMLTLLKWLKTGGVRSHMVQKKTTQMVLLINLSGTFTLMMKKSCMKMTK